MRKLTIIRHSFAHGKQSPILKRIENESDKGLIDVANGIIYDIGFNIKESMPDASVKIRSVNYLSNAEKMVVILKETGTDVSMFPELTPAQLDALKRSIREQPAAPAGPIIE